MPRPAHLFPAVLAVLGSAILLAGCQSKPADRLWVDSSVNGKPLHLFLDTGSTISTLNRATVADLGLPVTDPPPRADLPPGFLNLGVTAPAYFNLWGATSRVRFTVQDSPAYVRPDGDGVIGWSELRGKILNIDAATRQVQALDQLPADLTGWTRLRVYPSRQMLILEVPLFTGPPALISVDTGNTIGVGLTPALWRAWRADHPAAPATMHIYYTPSTGVITREQSWAREIVLGPLALTDTPVEEADPATAGAAGSRHAATLGLAALRRLDFIFDGPEHLVYLRPKTTPAEPFPHNRLGAVFTLLGPQQDAVVAHVEPNTPAAEAGLRDGDIVTAINNYTKLNWLKY
ncbi:MAG TPA: aspartyl protease family protein, partial [Opitutales bacterium]|nr:aspartyl protease family protein [Opitutales bacterium]